MGKAVIFDMDGLLFYTEGIHIDAYVKAFKAYNIDITEGDFYDHFAKIGPRLQDTIETYGSNVNIDDIRNKKRSIFKGMVSENLPVADGAEDVLERLYGMYPLALGTSSSRSNTDLLMDISGFGKYFDSIVTSTESKYVKPDPSCFRIASEGLGVDPDNCVVIEDANNGILAAKELGMKTIWVPNHVTKDEPASPDIKLQSLKEISPYTISRL